MTSTKLQWKDITPEEVKAMLNRKDIQLIDVREIDEYRAGHIPGITHVSLSQFVERTGEIDPEKEVICVCRSGNRSGTACEYLSSLGYKKLHNMVGGMNKWSGEIE